MVEKKLIVARYFIEEKIKVIFMKKKMYFVSCVIFFHLIIKLVNTNLC